MFAVIFLFSTIILLITAEKVGLQWNADDFIIAKSKVQPLCSVLEAVQSTKLVNISRCDAQSAVLKVLMPQ